MRCCLIILGCVYDLTPPQVRQRTLVSERLLSDPAQEMIVHVRTPPCDWQCVPECALASDSTLYACYQMAREV